MKTTMINEDIYSKLTSSAKAALDELSDQYRANLVDSAYRIARARSTGQEVSLRDIMDAMQISDKPPINKAEVRRRMLLTTISFSGIIYATIGFVIYLFQSRKFTLETDFGLLIAIIGLLLTLLSVFYIQIISKRAVLNSTKDNSIDSYEIVKKWQAIEKLVKNLMSHEDQQEAKSVGFLIRFLKHRIARDKDEYQKIQDLLLLRNRIIHEQFEPPLKDKEDFINFANELLKRLEDAVEEKRGEATIKIITATYGSPKNSIDLKTQLNKLIQNNRLEFVINNEIAGDPEPGIVKDFTIVYEINGQRISKQFKEGDKVSISDEILTKKTPDPIR